MYKSRDIISFERRKLTFRKFYKGFSLFSEEDGGKNFILIYVFYVYIFAENIFKYGSVKSSF